MRQLFLIIGLFLGTAISGLAQNKINQYEYWFDNGFASKTAVGIAPATEFNLNTTFSTHTLPNGLHSLQIRFGETTGAWSSTTTQFFVKVPRVAGIQPKLASCEYWFDNNYNIKVTEALGSQELVSLSKSITTTQLPDGLHTFQIRFKDNSGAWSSTTTQFFVKVPRVAGSQPKLASCEYWFDNNYNIKVTEALGSQELVSLSKSITTTQLPDGLHTFQIRFKDNAGAWSSTTTQFFVKKRIQVPFTENKIVAYRYWVGSQFDKKTDVTVTPINPLALKDSLLLMVDPKTMQSKEYGFMVKNNTPTVTLKSTELFNIQFKDILGQWSSASSDTISAKSAFIANCETIQLGIEKQKTWPQTDTLHCFVTESGGNRLLMVKTSKSVLIDVYDATGVKLKSFAKESSQLGDTLQVPQNSKIYIAVSGFTGTEGTYSLLVKSLINDIPIANAGSDQTVENSALVTLDGSLSAKGNGNRLTYKWTAPAGITLSSTDSIKPTFRATYFPVDSVLTFSLVVNNGLANSLPDSIKVTVRKGDVVHSTAGELSRILGNYKSSISKIAIDGTIDARDFKTMRDDMPLMADIDLSNATIVAYSGNLGTLPENATYQANVLPDYAFVNKESGLSKTSLTSFSLPLSVTTIANMAFCGCVNLAEIPIPPSVNYIGTYAFYGCSGLDSLKFPTSISSIDVGAFLNCTGLHSIYIPESIINIGNWAFGNSTGLFSVDLDNPNYSSLDGILYNKTQTKLIQYPISKKGNFSIPSSVNTVGTRAFEYCYDLDSIFIPPSVKSIEDGAFASCSGLNIVNIPYSVTTIGHSAFNYCINLVEITIPASVKSFGNYVFACKGLMSIYAKANTPLNLNSADAVFYNVNKTTCILYVPYGSKAAYQAADQWKDFTNIIEMAPAYAMPLNVTAGGLAALLPQQVRDTLTYLALTGTIDARDFKTMRDSMPLLADIDLSGVSIVAYTGTLGTRVSTSYTYPAKTLPDYAFCNTSSFTGKATLTRLKLPQSVLILGAYSLHGCKNLVDFEMPQSLQIIADRAFGECKGLSSLVVPPSVSTVAPDAVIFSNIILNVDVNNPYFSSIDGVVFNKNQTKLVLYSWVRQGGYVVPASVKKIDRLAFQYNSNLTSIELSSSLDSIADQAFWACRNLKKITIPASVGYIGGYAFKNSDSLSSVVFMGNAPASFGESVFDAVHLKFKINYYKTKTGFSTPSWKGYPCYPFNSKPLANAGNDQFVYENSKVSLNGGLSNDSDNDTLTYSWIAPNGIVLSSNTVARPTFTAPQVNSDTLFMFTLVVNDGFISSVADTVMVTVKNQTASNHFTTVWTGNGTDHMNINITTVKLDGLDLEAGDEVALFDGNLCVGVGLVTATVSNTNVLVIKASSNEGSGNGYTAGHAITYKLYDRSADKEYASVTATYSSSLPTWSTDGKYAVGATAFAQLNATATATQTIALRKGWNIVSATVMPSNPNLMGIFQPLVNTATLRKVMNEAGGTIEDWGEYGGWKNEIGNLLPTEGYKVNVLADCSLSVEGTVVPLPMDIPLNAGWNIIGYPAQVAQNGKDAMQSLIDSGKLRKVMDEAGRTIEDWGSFGGWINNIGSFAPGKGYKVNVTSACTLRIAETSLKSMMVEPTIQHSDKFQACFAGNGYNHMNINIVNLQQSGLCANDEIAIFDGDLCVGSATLSEGNMVQNRIAIATSANDGVSKTANGFTEGHPVQLKADHRGKVMETNLTDGKTFVQNGSLLIDLALFNQSLSSPSITKDADVFECYPNPFSSQLFIDVRNIRASDIDIAIYDVTGRKIKQVYSGANDGTTLYFWERGTALAGTYFCKVNGIVKKIIIID